MKQIPKLVLLLLLPFFIASCATTYNFPVSDVIPTAEISVKKKKVNNGFQIDLEAEHLANPDRLDPPKDLYVVWINTKSGIKKVGEFKTENAENAELNTLTPYEFTEIFITAEDNGNHSYPLGPEISRVILK